MLGLPWLLKHSSHIDMSAGSVLEWGKNCGEHCFLHREMPQDWISEEADKFDLHESPVSVMGCVVSDGQVGMDQQKPRP